MVYYLVAGSIATVAAIILLVIFIRKFPVAAALDLNAMRAFREKSRKDVLLQERLKRKWKAFKVVAGNIMRPVWAAMKSLFSRALQYLKTREERYRKAQRGENIDPAVLQQSLATMLEQGKQFLADEKFADAEKEFIAAIAVDHKSIEAYRGLTDVYIGLKQYPNATETLRFLQQIDPKNETIWQELGDLYRTQEMFEQALDSYEEAMHLNPNNPKNLDAVIELALQNKLKYKAQSALDKLQAVNPENQTIAEYQQQIDAL